MPMSISSLDAPSIRRSGFRQEGRPHRLLVLTDLFGGTPTNMCLSFLDEGKVDVLSGVTLPMLMKISTSRAGKSLAELSRLLRDYGRRHIVAASEVLGRGGRSRRSQTRPSS